MNLSEYIFPLAINYFVYNVSSESDSDQYSTHRIHSCYILVKSRSTLTIFIINLVIIYQERSQCPFEEIILNYKHSEKQAIYNIQIKNISFKCINRFFSPIRVAYVIFSLFSFLDELPPLLLLLLLLPLYTIIDLLFYFLSNAAFFLTEMYTAMPSYICIFFPYNVHIYLRNSQNFREII